MPAKFTFLYSAKSQDKEISLASENSAFCVITSDEFMSDFNFCINSSVCYNKKNLSGFAKTFNFEKIIVHKSEMIDKITLGNLIEFATENNIDIDFYGNKVDKNGFLPDSIEYLLLMCHFMRPSL